MIKLYSRMLQAEVDQDKVKDLCSAAEAKLKKQEFLKPDSDFPVGLLKKLNITLPKGK